MSDEERPASTHEVWTSAERTTALRTNAQRWSTASKEWTEVLLDALALSPGLRVLDIACGPGDPTLEVARRVGASGSVHGIDISDGALEVARERAAQAGLANATFRTANAESLPFPDADFDRVVSRCGVMFIEDLGRALREIRRTVRPAGRVAFMVWAPFDQPYWRATVGVVLEQLGLNELPPEQRVPFRFGVPDGLESGLRSAGFAHVSERLHEVHWALPDTPEGYVDEWWSTAVFFRPLLDRLPDTSVAGVRSEIVRRMAAFEHDGSLRVPAKVRVVTATRDD